MKYSSAIHFLKRFLQTPLVIADYFEFKKSAKNDDRFSIKFSDIYPCPFEKTKETSFDLHYLYHPAWAARVLAKSKPSSHVDISSILSFSTTISAFIPTDFYDYRPAKISLSNFSSHHADLLTLPFDDNSIESLSCMHTIEHIGLGRYGDPIDSRGDLKAINELKRVMAPGGSLLFVVPIGKPRIQFNAHRIYSYDQIREYFSDFELRESALISQYESPEKGLLLNPSPEQFNKERYGCGCFWFCKKQ